MPLTWDLTDVENLELIKQKDEWGLTETLIFCTMHTGIGKLTDTNADEFYARVHFLEQLYGPMLLATRDGERIDRPITPLDIKRRVGMKTNAAFKDETRASFIKRHVVATIKSGVYDYNRASLRNFEGRGDQFRETEDAVTD